MDCPEIKQVLVKRYDRFTRLAIKKASPKTGLSRHVAEISLADGAG